MVRGFEDLLELVQVLLHSMFEQLGCDSAEMTDWSGKAGERWRRVTAQGFPASETGFERRSCHTQEGCTSDASESSETNVPGARLAEKDPDSDPLDWVDQRVGLGQYPDDPKRFTR